MRTITLRGVEFGRAFCSSGALGFFGDGYWWHGLMRPFGLDWDGATFVAKTTTLAPRAGNMELREDMVTPRRLAPPCIKVDLLRGAVLNAVGLSGPGAWFLFQTGRWQARTRPFFLSFMSVAGTPEERLEELRVFCRIIRHRKDGFSAPFGLEINFSCPNVGLDPAELSEEVRTSLNAASAIGVPVVPNFGPDVPVEAALRAAEHPACDAISVANTVRWGRLPGLIDWRKLWGGTSPLAHLGGGGLSGAPLRPVVLGWVREARRAGLRKPLIAGGGVLSERDAVALLDAGADAVKLGTIGILRPWRVRGVISAVLED